MSDMPAKRKHTNPAANKRSRRTSTEVTVEASTSTQTRGATTEVSTNSETHSERREGNLPGVGIGWRVTVDASTTMEIGGSGQTTAREHTQTGSGDLAAPLTLLTG